MTSSSDTPASSSTTPPDSSTTSSAWYDSALGQWLSEDPLSFAAGDENLKRYVGNKSANLVDSSGLEETVSITIHVHLPNLAPSGLSQSVEDEIRRQLTTVLKENTKLMLTIKNYTTDKELAAVKTGRSGSNFHFGLRENPKLNLGGGKVAQGANYRAGIHPQKFLEQWSKAEYKGPGDKRSIVLATIILHELFYHALGIDYFAGRHHTKTGFIDSETPTIGGTFSPDVLTKLKGKLQ